MDRNQPGMTAPPRTPESLEAVFSAALQQHAAGRLEEAWRLCDSVQVRDPSHHQSLNLLGIIAAQRGALDMAINLIERAIQLRGDEPSYYSNLSVMLIDRGRAADALACARRAVALAPTYPEAHNNLGNALRELGELPEAAASYRKALMFNANYPAAHSNLGNVLKALSQYDDAIGSYRRAIAFEPNFADARYNLSTLLLARGELEEGWKQYEWRWRMPFYFASRRPFDQPQWRGEAAVGKTLLVHAEQGFGDTLQFCRFMPQLAALGFRVVLEAPQPLKRLLGRLPGVALLVGEGEDLPPFDLHIPMMSVPGALGVTLATVAGGEPYLQADPAVAEAWRARLATMTHEGPKVGLVWAGAASPSSPVFASTYLRRSIAPERLAPLFEATGVNFVSLQKEGPTAPAQFPLIDVMTEVGDFADTAALIANLDLVLSVDTAVAHLAAAMGKPVWLLNRFDTCWRWLLERRDSPWYPTVRVYRQPEPDDWDTVIGAVARDLAAFRGS